MNKEDFAVKHALDWVGRDESIERGQRYYITGKPCKYGHEHWRFVENHRCVQCGHYRSTGNHAKRDFGPSTTAISKSDAIHDELRLKRLLREMDL